jgi:hypothetical protein
VVTGKDKWKVSANIPCLLGVALPIFGPLALSRWIFTTTAGAKPAPRSLNVDLFSKVTGGVLAVPAFIMEIVGVPAVPWPGPGLAPGLVTLVLPFVQIPFCSSAQTWPSGQQILLQTRAVGQHLPLIISPDSPDKQGAGLPGSGALMHLPFLHSPPSQQVPSHANFSGQHKGDCVGPDTQVSPATQHLPPQETGGELPT